MNPRNSIMAGAAALAGLIAGAPAQAQNVQVGALTCDVSAGVGMIIASQREMVCTFRNSIGEQEFYTGVIRRFGLDIGVTGPSELVWGVFAPSGQIVRGALAGNYAGVGAEATVGAGLGANVLIGGSNRSVALQPLSLSGQTGLDVAAGVTSLELRSARPVAR